MTFLIVLVCTVVACAALRKPIQKLPVLFYVLAIVMDLLYVACVFGYLPHSMWTLMLPLMQKCTLSLAVFFVVMFIGVFSRDGKVSQWMRPIRAELSIIAWILSLGHMCVYLESYAERLFSGLVQGNVLGSLVVAVLLFVLLLVLGVTSFNAVKHRMTGRSWVKLQKLAYVFFGLVFVHLMLMLLPSALRGGETAQMSVAVYTALFGVYAVARIVRWRFDAKAGMGSAATRNNRFADSGEKMG